MLIVRPDGTLYLVELTVCYETSMPKNAQIKSDRYETTIEHLKVQMKCSFFAEFERATKIRKIAVYHFLIYFPFTELQTFKDE